jgi:hypothetical protein
VRHRLPTLLALTVAGLLTAPATPSAKLLPPFVIAPPSPDVRELGGAAMADDGTGGVAFLRRSTADGRVHVYAARFDGERWFEPQRVDVDQPGLPQSFDSSWARIGAAREGRLVVTWVHPRARDPETGLRFDAMYSAVLPRGGSSFLPPTVVDFDIRDAGHGAFPSLAMNSTGQALLSYRVVTTVGGPTGEGVPAGFVRSQTRVAHFNGSRWSVLGTRANRNAAAIVTAPTEANSPRVAIDPQGNGAIAFQEPDDVLQVDRVWIRRIFDRSRFGVPLMASPGELDGRPLNGDADSFALSAAPFGRFAVAWRQQPGTRSPLADTRVFVNTLPTIFDETAGRFTGALPADGAGPGAPAAPGAPAVAAGGREGFALAFAANEHPLLAIGDESGRTTVTPLPGGFAADPLISLGDEEDRMVVAWKAGGEATIQQRQEESLRASGSLGSSGGLVNQLALADSGHGDAIVAIQQGEVTSGRIAVRVVDAPPAPFALHLPTGWTGKGSPSLRWERAIDALGPVDYRVVLGKRTLGDTANLHLNVKRGRIRDGVHRVRVTAIDDSGQATASRPDTLRLDRRPPRARLRRRGGSSVILTSVDGPRKRTSGPAGSGNLVRWGDGTKTRGSARRPLRHTYRQPGSYRIAVTLRDRAGNETVRRLRVTIPG